MKTGTHIERLMIERDRHLDQLAGSEARLNAERVRCGMPPERSYYLACEVASAVEQIVEQRLKARPLSAFEQEREQAERERERQRETEKAQAYYRAIIDAAHFWKARGRIDAEEEERAAIDEALVERLANGGALQ